MPTEEEQQQPGTNAKHQPEDQPPAEKKEKTPEERPDSGTEVENEQKSEPCKVEWPKGDDSAQSASRIEGTIKEENKGEEALPVGRDDTHAEEIKKESTTPCIKADSSPQRQVSSTGSSEESSLVDKAPLPIATSVEPPVEEEDDDEEDDDEDGGDNEEQEDHSQRQQQQQKQRRDGYSNDDGSHHHRQNQSQTPTGGQFYEDDEEDEEDEGEEPSELRQLFEPINDSQAQSEDEEDGDYIPDEEVKKTIMVGSDFQAVIPEGLCRYDDALPYENEDKLLWNPTILNEQEIEDYLVKSTGSPGSLGGAGQTTGHQKAGSNPAGAGTGDPQSNSVFSIPLGNHLRDDEQSLYLLQQCGHNIDEALRRRRITNNAVPVPEQQMSIWSEEECRNFENGLRVHGKDFHMIQQTKVRTRSVGELVQFYYLWKKTERHDLFASKARLEKKKYNLHPGLTDHMDRFLEEQENSTGFGDRSSSPGFNSLYNSASEAKRQRLLDSKENNTASSKRSASNL